MLEEFGLVAEEDIAALLGIGLPSLRNRSAERLPEFVKVGRRRFYKEASVREWLGVPEKGRAAAPRPIRGQLPQIRSTLRDLAGIEGRLRSILALEKSGLSEEQRQYIQLGAISVAQSIFALQAAA
jgi:hypothetical protein